MITSKQRAYLIGLSNSLNPIVQVGMQGVTPEVELAEESEPYTVTYDAKTREYLVEGPRIERMLGYTNLETEKGFVFFQKFMVDNGIIDELKRLGCKEGDTVRLYGHGFEFFD